MAKKRIGYIDENQDEVKKFDRAFRDKFDIVTYDIEQGHTLEKLIDLIYDSQVDMLVIDYLMVNGGLVTYNGEEVARAYELIKPRFPMIIFTNEEKDAFPQVDDPKMIYPKNTDTNHLADIITRSIDLYLNLQQKHKETINLLLEKGEKAGLTAEEKHNLLSNQLELKNFDKRSVEVPFQLLDDKKIEDISKTKKEAEEYLKSLINKK